MAHLLELRTRLMMSLGALLIGTAVVYGFRTHVRTWLVAPFDNALAALGKDGGLSLVNSPFEGFYADLFIILGGGLAVAIPVIAYQVWLFVAPGLYQSERRVVLPLSMTSSALFLAGGLFCYYQILPYAFLFFLGFGDLNVSLSIISYLGAVLRMMIAFGLCFQFPVVVYFLARIGVIDHHDMRGAFRYAVIGCFTVSALITPPDPLTQVLLGIPLVLLYGVGIVVSWAVSTKVRQPAKTI